MKIYLIFKNNKELSMAVHFYNKNNLMCILEFYQMAEKGRVYFL